MARRAAIARAHSPTHAAIRVLRSTSNFIPCPSPSERSSSSAHRCMIERSATAAANSAVPAVLTSSGARGVGVGGMLAWSSPLRSAEPGDGELLRMGLPKRSSISSFISLMAFSSSAGESDASERRPRAGARRVTRREAPTPDRMRSIPDPRTPANLLHVCASLKQPSCLPASSLRRRRSRARPWPARAPAERTRTRILPSTHRQDRGYHSLLPPSAPAGAVDVTRGC